MYHDRWFRDFCERVNARVLKGAQKIRDRQGRFAKRAVMFEHPARQHRFRCFLEPLIDQYSDFTAQVRGMVEAGELETLQGRSRSRMQIVDGGHDARYSHGQTPMWTARNQRNRQTNNRRRILLNWHESCLVLFARLWKTGVITQALLVRQGMGAPCGFLGARPAMRSGSVSQERVVPGSRVRQNCTYGTLWGQGAYRGGNGRRIPPTWHFWKTGDRCFRQVTPVLPRRTWRLTRRPSATARVADKIVHHPADHGLDGFFSLGKYYGTS